ncbi:transposase [Limimaricola litoreus]|uniref:transposase n=1 Tax=Limimaricola litoreus TaxID=2955316 RepID=UPI00351643A9
MKRRTFSREFKLEAVKPVTERGVIGVRACWDQELFECVLHRWRREVEDAPLAGAPRPRAGGQPRAGRGHCPAQEGRSSRGGA